MALDMVSANGLIDETQRRQVTRALTQPSHPYADRFPESYAALQRICATIARDRWLGH